MAQVTTTTQADALAPPSNGGVARDINATNWPIYVTVRTAASTLTVYRSTDHGANFSSWASFSHTGLAEWSSLVIGIDGWAHLAYRVSTTGGGGTDTIWYRRMTTTGTSGSFSSGLQTSNDDANGGVAGGTWQGVDLAAVRNSNGSYAIVIAAARTQGTTRYGAQVMGVSIASGGSPKLNNNIISGTRAWWVSGTAPGRSGITCEVEHNGNGLTASPAHVWITWGRQRLEMVKLSWTGSSTGWSGPTKSVVIKSGLTSATDFPAGRWDGAQWLTAIISPDDTTTVRVYQRDRANTKTTTFDTPVHPTGVVRWYGLSYDLQTKNIRVYAVGTSTTVLYYVDYVRAVATWGSWSSVVGTAVLSGTEWSIRKGGTSGYSKHDLVYAVSGSPNTIQHIQQSSSSAPAIPLWDTSGLPYLNGSAADVAAALQLKWTFTDPDPVDIQGSYALSRQIGAGAVQYWNATTSTWGASEVQNTSANPNLLLSSGWGADSDAVHQYRVKVWDSNNVASPGYSATLQLTPSAKVNPTIVLPTVAQVITSDTVTVTWTVAEQSAFRVALFDSTLGQFVYDSGKQVSADLAFTPPYSMLNGHAFSASLWTYNNEGLASTQQTRAFTVAYAPPPASIATVTAVPGSGWNVVTSSALAPVGTQPAIDSQDLYRRPKLSGSVVGNGAIVGNTTGWSGVGGTLSYSTTQSHSGPGAARLVPSGAALDSQVSLTTPINITAGQSYTAGAWIRPDTINKAMRIWVNWYDSGGSLLGSSSVQVAAVPLAWQYLEITADPSPFPTAAKIGMAIGLTGTPAAGDAFYADDLTLTVANPDPGVRARGGREVAAGATANDWGAPAVVDHEYRWVVRGVNGTVIESPWAS